MTATVLVVDDSATIRQLVGDTLSAAGWKVVSAPNGQEALALVATGAVDLVITDWNMPGGGGLELITGIRAMDSCKHLPVLVLSTETDPHCRSEARAAGANGWMGKPVDPSMLTDIAATLLRTYKQTSSM